MRNEVEIEFNSCILRLFPILHPEQRERIHLFLLEHERKSVSIDRLCEAIKRAENSANIGAKFDRRRFDSFIETTVQMYADACLDFEKRKAMTHAQLQKEKDDAYYISDIEAEQEELISEFNSPRKTSRPGGVAT